MNKQRKAISAKLLATDPIMSPQFAYELTKKRKKFLTGEFAALKKMLTDVGVDVSKPEPFSEEEFKKVRRVLMGEIIETYDVKPEDTNANTNSELRGE